MLKSFCRSLLISGIGALFALSLAAQTAAQPTDTCKHTVTGVVENFELTSKIFENTRTIRVLLPPGYSDEANKDKRYPVLYMLDGQNLFDVCLSFNKKQEWRVDETVLELTNTGAIPPMIVVGIDNAGAQRSREYLPWKDNLFQPKMAEPEGRRHPEFLETEVMPAIDSKYRTAKGAENTAIGGSSYGGVAALYAAVTRPDLFSKAIVESPVLWMWNGELLRLTSPLPVGPRKVFIGVGDKEFGRAEEDALMVKLVRMLETNLKGALIRPVEVKTVIGVDGLHNEGEWARRFPEAIKFLYGSKP